MSEAENRRILVIDDSEAIHQDFKKILAAGSTDEDVELDALKAAFFGAENEATPRSEGYEVDSAHQGEIGLQKLLAAREAGRPYALAFVDVRMPPGWDGIRTVEELWKEDPDLQVVICTAFSDYSRAQTVDRLGLSDRWMILKKPFDPVEIEQLAAALTAKWDATNQARALIGDLRRAESEARSYASSLETVNQALQTSIASSDRRAEAISSHLSKLSREMSDYLRASLSPQGAGEGRVQCAEDLMARLEGVLLLDELDAVQEGAHVEVVDLRALVESLEAYARPLAAAQQCVLRFRSQGRLPSRFETSGKYLERALRGLLSHAVSRSTTGEVGFTVALDSGSSWDSCTLSFRITDSGIPLTSDEVGELLEPFGAGVGFELGVAKRIARLLDGDLGHENVLDGGASFTLCVEAGVVSGAELVEGLGEREAS